MDSPFAQPASPTSSSTPTSGCQNDSYCSRPTPNDLRAGPFEELGKDTESFDDRFVGGTQEGIETGAAVEAVEAGSATLELTDLFDESPFEATQFAATEVVEFPTMCYGATEDGVAPGHGQAGGILAEELAAGLSSYIAPASSYGEGEATDTSEADLSEAEAPTTHAVFPPDALRALPDVLQARPLVQLTATVPTEQVLRFIGRARSNLGTEPGWGERLLVDLRDLPKAVPKATVHVFVVKTVPFNVSETLSGWPFTHSRSA